MSTTITCSLCGKSHEGIYLSLKKPVNSDTVKHLSENSLRIKSTIYFCDNDGCETPVCNECITSLKTQTGFFSSHSNFLCPTCNKPLGNKPARVLICGYFPSVLNTDRLRQKYTFTTKYPVSTIVLKTNYLNSPLFPIECAICGRKENLHDEKCVELFSNNLRIDYSFKCCDRCNAIINHPDIKSPGAPYKPEPGYSSFNNPISEYRFASQKYAKKFEEINMQDPYDTERLLLGL